MSLRRPALLAVLLSSVVPGAALGASRPLAVAEEYPRDMSVVGDALAWTDSRCVKGCGGFAFGSTELARILLKRPGGATRELARAHLTDIPGGSNSILEDIRFAASPTHLVLLLAREENLADELSTETRVLAAPLEQAPVALFTCETYSLTFALDADRFAYVNSACQEGAGDVRVRSLRDGSETSVPAEGRIGTGIALAGDHLAVARFDQTTGSEISVWNWRTGVRLSTTALPPGRVVWDFDVGADGTLVYLATRGDPLTNCGILWALQPGDAAPRELMPAACRFARLAGEEALTLVDGDLFAVPVSSPDSLRELVRLKGTLPGLVEDDQRLGYAVLTCGFDTALHLMDLNDPTQFVGPTTCPLRFPQRRLRVGPGRSVPVKLRCPHGCAGRLALRRSGHVVARRDFEQDGRRGSVSLRLPRPLVAALRNRGALRAEVRTWSLQPTGRELERHRPVTLLP